MLLYHLLTNSAKEHPDRNAVMFKDNVISYKNLDIASSQLACCLTDQGIQPGDRVGVYIDKSIDAVVAIYGILKSRACYIPLDPLGPVERNSLIINDCGIKTLITASNKIFRIKEILKYTDGLQTLLIVNQTESESQFSLPGISIICKDRIFLHVGHSDQMKTGDADKNSLAYILYTSGSTGNPKGVKISHQAALAFVEWGFDTFHVNNEDILSAHAPFHFDLSVFDLYVAAKAGAAVCLVPQGMSAFPASLATFIEEYKISIWYSVPSVLTQLLLHGGIEERNLKTLKYILFAGEVFPSKYLKRLMELIPHAGFFNLYGPTETNVCAWYEVPTPPDPGQPIPIGKPCRGQHFYILDDQNHPVNSGTAGELYVNGPTLMDGYFNDPEKTQRSFIQDTFSGKNGRLYKTGDIVHINKDGDLEYHGRSDAMIKSRGYRIEPGEIEAALLTHPGIKESAVFGVDEDIIGKKIVACVVLAQDHQLTADDIKSYVSKKIPNYMIPEDVRIYKDPLPKTSTNKIDRNKLKNNE